MRTLVYVRTPSEPDAPHSVCVCVCDSQASWESSSGRGGGGEAGEGGEGLTGQQSSLQPTPSPPVPDFWPDTHRWEKPEPCETNVTFIWRKRFLSQEPDPVD